MAFWLASLDPETWELFESVVHLFEQRNLKGFKPSSRLQDPSAKPALSYSSIKDIYKLPSAVLRSLLIAVKRQQISISVSWILNGWPQKNFLPMWWKTWKSVWFLHVTLLEHDMSKHWIHCIAGAFSFCFSLSLSFWRKSIWGYKAAREFDHWSVCQKDCFK